MVCSINLLDSYRLLFFDGTTTQLTKVVSCRPMHDCVGVIIGGSNTLMDPCRSNIGGS